MSDAEAEFQRLRDRVVMLADPSVDRLLHIDTIVRGLWHALDRGEDVSARVKALHRVAAGRDADTTTRRDLMIAIDRAARNAKDPRILSEPSTDKRLTTLVCINLRHEEEIVKRLRESPAVVAEAVRAWTRTRGRPATGSKGEGKWKAIAGVAKLAGLPTVAEKVLEATWRNHGIRNP